MKRILMGLLCVFGLAANAEAVPASGFTHNNILYVTVLGDTCNKMKAHLAADPSCANNATCSASLQVIAGTKDCPGAKLKTYVFDFDLKKAKVGPNAETLFLSVFGNTIEIQINNGAN